MTQWHESDDFWETLGPYLFSRERIELARNQVAQIIETLNLKPGARVLDLCCGIGRHSLEFARRGCSVTGVDRTAAYLEQARARAAAENLSADFIQADARNFVSPASFDAAINLFSSFGYFDDASEDVKLVRAAWQSLKPGGFFVLDLLGKEILARVFSERTWSETDDGALLLEERKAAGGWNRVDSRWILVKGAARREFTMSLRLYSGSEIAALLKQAGFRDVALHGSLAAAPYDHRAERLVAIAHK